MNCSHTDEDHELVEKCKNGCADSFDALVNKYYPVVYSRANSFLNDPEEALDLTQEVFIDIYLALPSFRGDALFFTWMYQITTYKSKARLGYLIRKGHADSAKAVFDDCTFSSDYVSDCSDVENAVLDCQRREVIQAGLDKLHEIDQQVLVLKDIRGYSRIEIAKKLGLTEDAVRNRLAKARSLLRHYISEMVDISEFLDISPGSQGQIESSIS